MKALLFPWHHGTLLPAWEKGDSMRTLFAFVVFAFLGNTNLAAQIFPPPAKPARPALETRIYLVTFQRGIPLSQRAAVVQASGARLRMTYTAANAVSVEVPDAAGLARLRNDPRVLSVFMNRPIKLLAAQGRSGGIGISSAKPKAPPAWKLLRFLQVRLRLPGATTPTTKLDSRSSGAPAPLVRTSPRFPQSAPTSTPSATLG